MIDYVEQLRHRVNAMVEEMNNAIDDAAWDMLSDPQMSVKVDHYSDGWTVEKRHDLEPQKIHYQQHYTPLPKQED